MLKPPAYTTDIAPGGHWSLLMRRGTYMTLTDTEGGANVGMVMFNPAQTLERYNAPDTLKCQHTFRLSRGNCLYSDMGRIFCSVVADDFGWHESICGNIRAADVTARWGARDYQRDRNGWKQNGHDAFLVELGKYGLSPRDLPANVNWFSKVVADDGGRLRLDRGAARPGASVSLRFEMDSLVLLHTCPHPLDDSETYPARPVRIDIGRAEPVGQDDYCRNFRPENQRGFHNNELYHLGLAES